MRHFRYIILIYFFSLNLFAKIPSTIGKNGAVVSSNKYATEIGINVLKEGGNAIDAAVAVGFALAVVHPSAGNIGGGGFMLVKLADGSIKSIDFREKAPLRAYGDMFLDENDDVIEGKSWNSSYSIGVPGSVAGYGLVHQNYGTLSWKELIKPSIELAEFGFEVDYFLMQLLNSKRYKQFLMNDEVSRKVFVKSDSSNYQFQERLYQYDLSETLNRIADNGYKEFYYGKTASQIVSCMKRIKGLITYDDLESYQAIIREPIHFKYRGYSIFSMPPPSSGGIVLAQILNQLENVDFSDIHLHSSKHIHHYVESCKRAYAVRAQLLGDMDYVEIPIKKIISKEYSDSLWLTFDENIATESYNLNPNLFINESEETTHFSIVDKFGNAVSVTTTINGWFGSGISVDGAGFILNNEMDDFSIKPGYPNEYGLIGSVANSIQPGKRMLSSMTPTIVLDSDNELFLSLGSPGGSTIITTVAQIINNIIDFEMNIQEAVELDRIHHQWYPDIIQYESKAINSDTKLILEKMNHKLISRTDIGEANCIFYDSSQSLFFGAADTRRSSYPMAY